MSTSNIEKRNQDLRNGDCSSWILKSAVQPLLPYEAGPRGLALAANMRAGRWVFASGLMPTQCWLRARPLSGEPR
jgi:hypothetical protein